MARGCPPWPLSSGRGERSTQEAMDIALVAMSTLLILAYHILYYRWRFFSLIEGRGFHRVDLAGQRGREVFVRAVCGADGDGGDANADSNIAIQAARNPITAGSLLATGASLGATTLVNILLDAQKLEAIKRLGENDPLVGAHGWWSPAAKISSAVGILLL